MARKKTRRKKNGFKIPLLTVAGAVPGISNMHRAGDQKIHLADSGYFPNVGVEASRIYLGMDSRIGADPKWNFAWMMEGSVPLILGAFASKIAGRFGINRMFKGLPIRL